MSESYLEVSFSLRFRGVTVNGSYRRSIVSLCLRNLPWAIDRWLVIVFLFMDARDQLAITANNRLTSSPSVWTFLPFLCWDQVIGYGLLARDYPMWCSSSLWFLISWLSGSLLFSHLSGAAINLRIPQLRFQNNPWVTLHIFFLGLSIGKGLFILFLFLCHRSSSKIYDIHTWDQQASVLFYDFKFLERLFPSLDYWFGDFLIHRRLSSSCVSWFLVTADKQMLFLDGFLLKR